LRRLGLVNYSGIKGMRYLRVVQECGALRRVFKYRIAVLVMEKRNILFLTFGVIIILWGINLFSILVFQSAALPIPILGNLSWSVLLLLISVVGIIYLFFTKKSALKQKEIKKK
jgi:hypothetical protein